MDTRVTSVSRCLEKKLLVFGFEVFDLMLIFLTMAILNFFFGSGSSKLFFVWLPASSLAVALRLGKRGKPDLFLVHWIRFKMMPGLLCAFSEPTRSNAITRKVKS
jgi:hypothetical protein